MKTSIHALFLLLCLWMDCELNTWGQGKTLGVYVQISRGNLFHTVSFSYCGQRLSSRALPDCPPPFWFSFCAGESRGEQLEQQPSTLSVGEGDSAIINCTYTGSGSSYFPWYKQEAGKSPHLVIDIFENVDRKQNQRLTILLDKKAKKLSLHITATQPGDSAIYFCAASTHWFPGTCSLFSNLLGGAGAPSISCVLQ